MADLQERLQAALGSAYRLERELGGGGMSRVFVAEEVELGRRVVVKVLPPEMAAGVNAERFRREIQLAASLQHPHIVPLLSAGHREDLVYYTMPFIEGESLRAKLAREGTLPVRETVRVLRDLVDALAYAHDRGVLHRDIKPDNVLVTRQHAVVTDFGVAKAITQATGSSTLTSAGVSLGTPAYMAPEQVAADPNVDHRCDLYAVGALAYELLAGVPPFLAPSPQQVLMAHVTESPLPLSKRRPDVPPALSALVMRCLEKLPADRWASAGDLLHQIEAMLTPAEGSGPVLLPAISRAQRWRAWVVALVAVGLGVMGWRVLAHREAPSSSTAIAVLPFAVRGSGQYAYLGEGIVNLLSTSLDGAGDLRSVNAHALLSYLATDRTAATGPDRAEAVAGRFGAGLYVLGDVLEVGGQLRLSASLFVRGRGAQPIAEATAEGEPGEILRLVDQLAAQLAAGRTAGSGARISRIAAVTTSSLPALKAYLEGERLYRAGQFAAAVDAFQNAVRADTGFALAFYRLSMAHERLVWADDSRRAAEQAYRHSERMSAHDRQFLEAVLAVRRGAAQEAEGLFRAIVGTYPDDAEAWYQLGELQFHGNPLRGLPMTAAREPFTRALFYDPSDLGALFHLIRIAAREHHGPELDSLAARFLQLSPAGDRTLEVRSLYAATTGDRHGLDQVIGDLERAPDNTLPLVAWSTAAFTHDLRSAERVARLMTETARAPDVQAAGHLLLAHLELAMGRRRAALDELRAADALGEPGAREAEAWFAAFPFLAPSGDDLASLRRRLEAWDAASEPTSPRPSAFFSAHSRVHAILRTYLLGLLSARAGDTAAAARYARDLEQRAGSAEGGALARELGHGVRAQVALAAGRPLEALAVLERGQPQGWYELTFVSPFYSGALERYTRAELLWGQNRAEDALGWYVGLGDNSVGDLVFLGPSDYRRALIEERLGRREAARELYRAFVALWGECDPELRPMVEDARTRLERLEGR